MFIFTENNGADGVALEIQRQAIGVAGKFQHLALHRVGQTVNAADTIGHRDDRTLIADLGACADTLDPALDQLADFRRVELHVSS